MLKIFVAVTGILLLAVIYYNLFVLIPEPIILGVYPYVLIMTVILTILLILLKFVENPTLIKGVSLVITVLLIVMGYTFIQVARNAELLNGYQKKEVII